MKNIKYLFVMVFAVVLSVSCSKDDDNNSDLSTNALVGSWETTDIQEGIDYNITATFNSNNSGTMVMVSTLDGDTKTETFDFTWSTSGDKLTFSVSGGSDFILTYSITGNKLTTIDEDDEVIVFTKQ